MNKKYALFSAVPRSGNTFLSRCLTSAIEINSHQNIDIRVSSHIHSPAILSFDQTDDIKIYTLFRNPLDNIISSTVHKIFFHKGPSYKFDNDFSVINYNINKSISQYVEYLEFQRKNQKATVIMFDKLINDPHYIVERLLIDCGAVYENKISIDDITLGIKSEDKNLYMNGEGDFANGALHLPHDIESTPIYEILKKDLPLMPIYQNLESLYYETLYETKMSDCRIYD